MMVVRVQERNSDNRPFSHTPIRLNQFGISVLVIVDSDEHPSSYFKVNGELGNRICTLWERYIGLNVDMVARTRVM
ncbi:hypothetical protein CC2G_002212 [Coprinopsis cinerea AmutBmut pab1-1]|nr:hypothetical protein CC2G_002212 [Coprinopsis cinerea AmutBmut pab1-1]